MRSRHRRMRVPSLSKRRHMQPIRQLLHLHLPSWIFRHKLPDQRRRLYRKPNCQNKIYLCDSSPCFNDTICQDNTTQYTCHCPSGYTGKNCGEHVDWCGTNPCENGATCNQIKNNYQCSCAPGWTGKVCDVEMVSCKDASMRKGKSILYLTNHQHKSSS